MPGNQVPVPTVRLGAESNFFDLQKKKSLAGKWLTDFFWIKDWGIRS